ncbi:sulfatase [Bacteroidota bacterium]
MTKGTYSRRDFVKIIGIGSVAFSCKQIFDLSDNDWSKKPNIIYIMSDDHASHAISSYGSKINETPNIDRIANEGYRFNNCFCTNSICAPSRATILTGKYSHRNGVMGNKDIFDDSQQTFPKLLQKSGYETAIIGKWHLKSTPTGFDYWNILPGQGYYYNPDFIEMGERKNYIGYVTDLITDKALEWLDNRNNQKPFCLLYQHKATHGSWLPPLKYLNKYDEIDIPVPATFNDNYATRSSAAKAATMRMADDFYYGWHLKLDPNLDEREVIRNMGADVFNRMTNEQKKKWDAAYGPKNEKFYESDLTGDELVHWKYQRFIKDYLRCVASLDDNIGRLLDYLDSSGLAENTIVIYTSDQGFFLGDHGWWDKRFMYEESLRMPLVIRYPKGIKPGVVNDDMVLNIDFAPTLLESAGIKVPPEMQGKSILKLLKGKTPEDWRTSMYYHYYEYPGRPEIKKHYGIRTKRYKLIHFYYDIDEWELYDLDKDPNELNNVYNNPGYSDIVNNLKKELKKLQDKYGDMDF